MLTKRWARPVGALLILFLLPVITSAQATAPPKPSPTATPPASSDPTTPGTAVPTQEQPAVPPEVKTLPAAPEKQSKPRAGKSFKSPANKQSPTSAQIEPISLESRIKLGDSRHVWHPTREQLGLSQTDSGFSIDPDKVRAYLTSIAPYVHCLPVNARIVVRSKSATNQVSVRQDNVPRPIKVLPGGAGINLNVDASVKVIQKAIEADPNTQHIALAVKSTPARISATKFAGIDSRISHFVTHFNPGERGRTQTVRLAISLIDGHIVPPQSILSVNQTVGERTAQRGFGKGIVFVSGHLDTQLGGGMCQVATTLFNTILLANLKVVERHQHIRTVPYVKPGEDATVYWGQKDFKFQNDTDTPLYISYKTTATHAICDIYGKGNPGVKVSLKDDYQRLGPRHYTAVLKRFVTKNGTTTVDYTAKSAYKWTPALDYSM